MNNIRTTLAVVGSVFILCACSDYGKSKTQIQKEIIEILEQAKNSSDPAVLKQAELVRMDIDKDYQSMKYEVENGEETESTIDKLIVVSLAILSCIILYFAATW